MDLDLDLDDSRQSPDGYFGGENNLLVTLQKAIELTFFDLYRLLKIISDI